MILQSSKNSKRNRERDVNTLRGNTLGLWGPIIFCFILLPQKLSVVSDQTTINHGFWIVTKAFSGMCAKIYSLYAMIDMFDILIVFIKSEKWRTIKRLCRDWYIYDDMLIVWFRYVFRTLELKYTMRHSAIYTLQCLLCFQYQYS